MSNEQNKNKPEAPNPGSEKSPKSNIALAVTIAILVVLAIGSVFNMISESQYTKTTWSDFRSEMAAGNLSEVEQLQLRTYALAKKQRALATLSDDELIAFATEATAIHTAPSRETEENTEEGGEEQ